MSPFNRFSWYNQTTSTKNLEQWFNKTNKNNNTNTYTNKQTIHDLLILVQEQDKTHTSTSRQHRRMSKLGGALIFISMQTHMAQNPTSNMLYRCIIPKVKWLCKIWSGNQLSLKIETPSKVPTLWLKFTRWWRINLLLSRSNEGHVAYDFPQQSRTATITTKRKCSNWCTFKLEKIIIYI